MYKYVYDDTTGGILLTTESEKLSKEPRPVYYKELDILGFDKYWNYPKDDSAPLMWAEANNYYYRGRLVAKTKGGALYTAPELIIIEEPEPGGAPLKPVDIEAMCSKNADMLESLSQETIKGIYNTYVRYKDKVDLFYVAFSGGKDSVVTLDLVSRSLPHNEFMVLFGDTGMEFPDTYDVVDKVEQWCAENDIRFLRAKSKFMPQESWKIFGPPATVTRWCCSVHKTAPQILKLRKLLNKNDFTGMAYVGVRAEESLSRSKYDYITLGGKHQGQYSCNAILDWSSAEIYLYIYLNRLNLNSSYKKGNKRAGCLVCPGASERNEYMGVRNYPKESEVLIDEIRKAYKDKFDKEDDLNNFLINAGWKARKNGRDLAIEVAYTDNLNKNNDTVIEIYNPRTNWKEWIKTLGNLIKDKDHYQINFNGNLIPFAVNDKGKELNVTITNDIVKKNPTFVKYLKQVFRKAASCVGCGECEAECKFGSIEVKNNNITINETCKHCLRCHNVDKGCLVYKSLEKPKGGFKMGGKQKSLNCYSHHAPTMNWIQQYFKYKNDFNEKHSLGKNMHDFFKRFLRDAKLLDKNGFTKTAEVIDTLGLNNKSAWGIILTNISYAPQVGWYTTLNFDEEYSKEYLKSLLIEAGAKETWTDDVFSSLVRLSELPLGKVGIGKAYKVKNRAISLTRYRWVDPDPRVILYSLYKFAEECGGTYQFTLSDLLDDEVQRDGISPTRIFGISREEMIPILNGLSVNYPDFISATFSLNLEKITLKEDKTAEDVLAIF